MKIQNSSTIKEVRQVGGLSISEGFPQELGSTIVPVVNVNPKAYRTINIVKFAQGTATGNTVVYTTPTDRDFYLTNYVFSSSANATADSTFARLFVSTDEFPAGVYIAELAKQTLTEFAGTVSMAFPVPMKLKRGTNVIVYQEFTVGASNGSAAIQGYTVEPFENV